MKYILKKEYPGSPKLGNIIDNLENDWIENYPEFWEEVVEKDYEILSYIHNGSKHIWKKDPKFETYFYINQGLNPCTRLEDILKYPKVYLIHSVKRNDGEIFTIGDKVVGYNNSIAKIKTIDLVGEISLNIGTDKSEGFSLKNLKKVKQPLFTTEDGVDIFEDDNLYSIDNMLNIKKHLLFNARYDDNTLLNNRIFFNSDYKHFSTKEKAEEYILLNKPCLSYGDVQEYLKVKDCNKVLDLAQSKIQQSV